MVATLFTAMVTTLPLPAYGQQEVDPTWYNPWAAPTTAVAHSPQSQAAAHRHQPAPRRVSTSQGAQKSRVKHYPTEAVLTRPAK